MLKHNLNEIIHFIFGAMGRRGCCTNSLAILKCCSTAKFLETLVSAVLSQKVAYPENFRKEPGFEIISFPSPKNDLDSGKHVLFSNKPFIALASATTD